MPSRGQRNNMFLLHILCVYSVCLFEQHDEKARKTTKLTSGNLNAFVTNPFLIPINCICPQLGIRNKSTLRHVCARARGCSRYPQCCCCIYVCFITLLLLLFDYQTMYLWRLLINNCPSLPVPLSGKQKNVQFNEKCFYVWQTRVRKKSIIRNSIRNDSLFISIEQEREIDEVTEL